MFDEQISEGADHDWHGNSKNSTSLLLQKASHDIDIMHFISGRYATKVVGMGGLDYYGGDKPDDLRCPDCDVQDTCVEYHHTEFRVANKLDMCAFRKEIDVEGLRQILDEPEEEDSV